MNKSELQIISMPNVVERYLVVDSDFKIVHDANGYGFKTERAAKKCIWYLTGGKDYLKKKRIQKKEHILVDTNLSDSPF